MQGLKGYLEFEEAIRCSAESIDVTPSDATIYTPPLDAVAVAGAGNVALTLANDTEITIISAQAHSVWKFSAKKVKATGTTATGIKGLRA